MLLTPGQLKYEIQHYYFGAMMMRMFSSSSPRSRRLAPRRKRAYTPTLGVIAFFALCIYSMTFTFTIKLHKESLRSDSDNIHLKSINNHGSPNYSSSLVGDNESKASVQVRGEKESTHGDKKETFVETLDFIHITKTGGTSIEGAAAQIGIAWGYCKYHPKNTFCVPSRSRNRRNKSTMSMDTKCKIGGPKNTAVAPWHCPPNQLQMNEGKGKGKGGQTQHQVHHQRNINTSKKFAIVRDPYARIISEYYWAHSWARKDERNSTAEYLNSWIKEQLALVEKFGACVHGHCIPMYKYTHDDWLPSQSNTTLPRQVADHIIHLENITVELPVLMEQYGHPYKDIQLGEEKRKGRGTIDKLDVHHLTNETLCMINRWAEMDFKLFGYEMVEVAGCFDGERAAFEVQQEQEQREEAATDPSHIVMTVAAADVLAKWYPKEIDGKKGCVFDSHYNGIYSSFGLLFDSEKGCCDAFPDAECIM